MFFDVYTKKYFLLILFLICLFPLNIHAQSEGLSGVLLDKINQATSILKLDIGGEPRQLPQTLQRRYATANISFGFQDVAKKIYCGVISFIKIQCVEKEIENLQTFTLTEEKENILPRRNETVIDVENIIPTTPTKIIERIVSPVSYVGPSPVSYEFVEQRLQALKQEILAQVNTRPVVVSGGISINSIKRAKKDLREEISAIQNSSLADLTDFTTDDLLEGITNIYFTNNRAIDALTGQNISLFVNDSNYITSLTGLSISDLDNDAGYLNSIAGLNISSLTNDSNYLTTITGLNISELNNDSSYISNISAFSTDDLVQGATNLYSQWITDGADIEYNAGIVNIGSYYIDQSGYFSGTSEITNYAYNSNNNLGSFFTGNGYSLDAENNPISGLSLGSVSAPAISFSGDSNTGIWSPNADTLAWSTAGVERMRFDNNGNVGIGTTSPGTLLDVNGVARATQLSLAGTNTYSLQNGAGQDASANNFLIKSSTNTIFSLTSIGEASFGGSSAFLAVADRSGGYANRMGFYANQNTANLYSVSLAQNIFSVGTTNGRISLGRTAYGYVGNNATSTVNVLGFAGVDPFDIASSTGASMLRVTQSGNVGIGTTTPLAKLVINDSIAANQVGVSINNSNTSGYSVFRIGTASAAAVGMALHQFNSAYSGTGTYTALTTTLSAFESGGLNLHADNAAGVIRFFTAGNTASNERMRITSAGLVGIGITSPALALHVVKSDSTKGLIRLQNSSASGYSSFELYNSSSGFAAAIGYGNASTAVYPGLFYINGASTVPVIFGINNIEYVRLHTNGNFGIGTTTPTQKLSVIGNAQFTAVGSGAYAFDLNLTSDGTLTTSASDERLKTDITTLDSVDVLEKITQLNPTSFTWKSNSAHDIGLIAQEVENIFPELVFTNPTDGYKGINYSRISTLLISAVSELAQRVEIMFAWFGENRFNVQGDICVDDVCISKDQFKALIQSSVSNIGSIIPSNSTSNNSNSDSNQNGTTTNNSTEEDVSSGSNTDTSGGDTPSESGASNTDSGESTGTSESNSNTTESSSGGDSTSASESSSSPSSDTSSNSSGGGSSSDSSVSE